EVLLAQGDDELKQGLLFGGDVGPLVGGEEEAAAGSLAVLVGQEKDAAVGVAEAFGDFRGVATLEDVASQDIVLMLVRVGRFLEVVRQRCKVLSCTHKLIPTMSDVEQEDVSNRERVRKSATVHG